MNLFTMIEAWLFPKNQPVKEQPIDEETRARRALAREVVNANRLRNVLVAQLAKAKGISYFKADALLMITPRSLWSLPEERDTLQVEGVQGTATSQSITPGWDILIAPLDEEELADCRSNWDRYVAMIAAYHHSGQWEGSPDRRLHWLGTDVLQLTLRGSQESIIDLLTVLNTKDDSPWLFVKDVSVFPLKERGDAWASVFVVKNSEGQS